MKSSLSSSGLTPAIARRIARVLAAVLVGNAIGLFTLSEASTAKGSPQTAASDSAATETTRSDALASSTTAPVGQPRAKTQTPARKTPTTTAAPAVEAPERLPIMSEGLDFEFTFSPTCARVGETFTATTRIKPVVMAASFMPFYSDNTTEEGKAVVGEGDGVVTYQWVAKPILGEGRLVAQVSNSETQERGTKIVAFRVVGVDESC